MKVWGPLLKIINNFKMVTAEHEAEGRVSVSVRASCHHIGPTPLEPAPQRGESPGQPRRLTLAYVIKSGAHLCFVFLTQSHQPPSADGVRATFY